MFRCKTIYHLFFDIQIDTMTSIPDNTTPIDNSSFPPEFITNEYTLGKIKQLIDINGNATNFKCGFKIQSKNNVPFLAVILTQSTLDNSESLDFQPANGELSGEIVADKNVFHNYFLVLKASDEHPNVNVSVSLQFEKLPDKLSAERTRSKSKKTSQQNSQSADTDSILQSPYMQIGIGAGITCAILYFMIQNKLIDLNALFDGSRNSSSTGLSGNSNSSSGIHKSLLDKLKQLPME